LEFLSCKTLKGNVVESLLGANWWRHVRYESRCATSLECNDVN